MTVPIQKTITTTRTATSLDCAGVQQIKTPEGWVAIIEGVITYDDGGSDRIQVVKKDQSYNEFWAAYNSGAYLFQVLVSGLDLDTEIPAEIEETFINSVNNGVE